MWPIWGKRCLAGLAAACVLGVSMLIIWLLVQYLSYGNRGEEVAADTGYEAGAETETQRENIETRDLDKIGIKERNGLEKEKVRQKRTDRRWRIQKRQICWKAKL